MYPDEVQISMVVVKFKTNINRVKKGICSTWLSLLDPVTRAPIFVYPLEL